MRDAMASATGALGASRLASFQSGTGRFRAANKLPGHSPLLCSGQILLKFEIDSAGLLPSANDC